MFSFLPRWDSIHPLVVHFPIALLLIAPIFVLLAILWRRHELPISVAALMLMALGTIGAFVAAATGEAAESAAKTSAARAVLDRHEDLAEAVEICFSILTLLFAGLIGVPRLIQRPLPRRAWVLTNGTFLVLYMAGLVVLVIAAHQGGRLVHELGVHSPMT